MLLPIVYLLSMIRAWRHRDEIQAKSGGLGLFSLWFPLLTTLAAAWVILWLMPTLLGTPIDNPALFQPDLGMPMIATAGLGVVGVHSSLTGDGHRRRDIRSAYRSCSLEPTGFRRQCHVSALWNLGRVGMTRHDQDRRSTMFYPTLQAAGAIIAERRRQAERARRARRSEHNEMSDLGLTVEDVMADLDPGWLTRRISLLQRNTDQLAGVAFSEGVLS